MLLLSIMRGTYIPFERTGLLERPQLTEKLTGVVAWPRDKNEITGNIVIQTKPL